MSAEESAQEIVQPDQWNVPGHHNAHSVAVDLSCTALTIAPRQKVLFGQGLAPRGKGVVYVGLCKPTVVTEGFCGRCAQCFR